LNVGKWTEWYPRPRCDSPGDRMLPIDITAIAGGDLRLLRQCGCHAEKPQRSPSKLCSSPVGFEVGCCSARAGRGRQCGQSPPTSASAGRPTGQADRRLFDSRSMAGNARPELVLAMQTLGGEQCQSLFIAGLSFRRATTAHCEELAGCERNPLRPDRPRCTACGERPVRASLRRALDAHPLELHQHPNLRGDALVYCNRRARIVLFDEVENPLPVIIAGGDHSSLTPCLHPL
jgi:hypothetical protein